MYTDLKSILPFITKKDCDDILLGKTNINTILATNQHYLTDVESKAVEEICEKYKAISKGQVLNHITFKLSDLDLEMIRDVPQGGNWKDIPPETIKKSQRLIQITRTGGRTTLYGRLDYQKPSFTISTYFNRPGNGTFVHPVHNRTISPREAARFQSFKDDYYFSGTKGKILKQIGNAVPPLMAMQIALRIKEKTGYSKTIGLFSGAGGLTTGFKEAGMSSVLETDFDFDACVTCKVNNPEIPVLCADITEKTTKDTIVEIASLEGVDIICGGPPCQGFSMAGKRFIDDPRNQLFKHYADVVGQIKPKVFVFENVEGLLSMSKGQVYREIFDLFSSFGYVMTGHVLNSVDYGVPQKRKRVIVIGVRNDLNIDPETLYPEKTTPMEKDRVTSKDTIDDLEDVPCGLKAYYDETKTLSTYEKEMRSKLPYGAHINL
jgi:DNA (cytosine-5)-methyltransferase 1